MCRTTQCEDPLCASLDEEIRGIGKGSFDLRRLKINEIDALVMLQNVDVWMSHSSFTMNGA